MKHHTRVGPQGFAHYLLLGVVVVGVAVVATFATVLKAHHDDTTKANAQASTKGLSSQSSLSSNAKSKSGASTAAVPASTTTATSTSTPASTPSSTVSTASTPAKTTAKANTTTSKPSSSSSSVSASSAATTTPLSALTAIITTLDNGTGSANVTASPVPVAGPVTPGAKAQPIVFKANGITYFAYTQESPPNFNLTPAQTANTMAITVGSGNPSLVGAVIDKSGELVDADYQSVGFSTGGD